MCKKTKTAVSLVPSSAIKHPKKKKKQDDGRGVHARAHPQPGRRGPGPARVSLSFGARARARVCVCVCDRVCVCEGALLRLPLPRLALSRPSHSRPSRQPPPRQLRGNRRPPALFPVPDRLVLWAGLPAGQCVWEGRERQKEGRWVSYRREGVPAGALPLPHATGPPPHHQIPTGVLALPPRALPGQRICRRPGGGGAQVCGVDAAPRPPGETRERREGGRERERDIER